MKKILFALAAMAIVAVSCEKNPDEGGATAKPLEATLELTTELAALPYGQPTEILGTITTEATLESYILTAVKKSGEEYVAVGEAQTYTATGNELKVEFFADSKDMTDIEVVLKETLNCEQGFLVKGFKKISHECCPGNSKFSAGFGSHFTRQIA